ncbi:MAG: hypothetical protein LBG96_07495 [Tannerella sp.]|jgi:hypothetical protein|nr:hypothetical protein [Tannerella sp.]
MIFEPHRLYLFVEESREFVCGCFLHDVTVAIMRGYAGTGVAPKYYVNLDRRDDLLVGQEVTVMEADGATVRGRGEIMDIKRTSGMRYAGREEYMTIYIG